jgi:hypothetical protein
MPGYISNRNMIRLLTIFQAFGAPSCADKVQTQAPTPENRHEEKTARVAPQRRHPRPDLMYSATYSTGSTNTEWEKCRQRFRAAELTFRDEAPKVYPRYRILSWAREEETGDNDVWVDIAPGRTWNFQATMVVPEKLQHVSAMAIDSEVTKKLKTCWSRLDDELGVLIGRKSKGAVALLRVSSERTEYELAEHPLTKLFLRLFKKAAEECIDRR